MSENNYPKIETKDIRKGDKIRVDLTKARLPVADYVEYTAKHDGNNYNVSSPHYLKERPVELTTGVIVQSTSDSRDYWIRTGENNWAGVYLGIRQFCPKTTIGDDHVKFWLRVGKATVVDTGA